MGTRLRGLRLLPQNMSPRVAALVHGVRGAFTAAEVFSRRDRP